MKHSARKAFRQQTGIQFTDAQADRFKKKTNEGQQVTYVKCL
jgi:hypothetical protein